MPGEKSAGVALSDRASKGQKTGFEQKRDEGVGKGVDKKSVTGSHTGI